MHALYKTARVFGIDTNTTRGVGELAWMQWNGRSTDLELAVLHYGDQLLPVLPPYSDSRWILSIPMMILSAPYSLILHQRNFLGCQVNITAWADSKEVLTELKAPQHPFYRLELLRLELHRRRVRIPDTPIRNRMWSRIDMSDTQGFEFCSYYSQYDNTIDLLYEGRFGTADRFLEYTNTKGTQP